MGNTDANQRKPVCMHLAPSVAWTVNALRQSRKKHSRDQNPNSSFWAKAHKRKFEILGRKWCCHYSSQWAEASHRRGYVASLVRKCLWLVSLYFLFLTLDSPYFFIHPSTLLNFPLFGVSALGYNVSPQPFLWVAVYYKFSSSSTDLAPLIL